MAGLTDEEEEREQPQPHIRPDIEKIAAIVGKDGRIDKAEEKAQKARSELGNAYKHIENDLHGNRKAVKTIRGLLTGTTDAAHDFMRTFMYLADHFGLIPEEDLVDMMGSRTPTDERQPEEPGVSAADVAPKTPKKPDLKVVGDNAIDRQTRRLKDGERPPAPKGPDGDTDLVEAGEKVAEEIEAQRREDAAAFEDTTANGNGAAPAPAA